MQITPEFVKQLVQRNESQVLDFKRDQYKLKKDTNGKKATNEEKSELLKDILAFANAFNTVDSFILIGVQQMPVPPHKVVGVKTTIDDASIQEFVRGTSNLCPEFHYEQIDVDAKIVGVLRIPSQLGPFQVKKTFGSQVLERIPVRQGTSTDYVSINEYSARLRADGAAQAVQTNSGHIAISVNQALQSRVVRLQSLVSGRADDKLAKCSLLIKHGNIDEALTEVDRVLTDEELMHELEPDSAARVYRTKANLLLRTGNHKGAEQILNLADSLAVEDEPRMRAMLALNQSGVSEAIRVLGNPTSDDGLQLAAQLLIADRKPDRALNILPKDEPIPANAIRPRTLAHLLLNNRVEALESANEALKREPEWLDSLVTAGIAYYFCAVSPALTPQQIVAPDPVPPPLFIDDPKSLNHLHRAEELFRTALQKNISQDEELHLEVWLLAVLASQPDRRNDAAHVLDSILEKDPAHTTAVLWAVFYAIQFDRDFVRERCLTELDGDDANASFVVTYLALEHEPTNESLSFLEEHRALFDAQVQMDVYESWHRRLTEELGLSEPSSWKVSPSVAATHARETGDWSSLPALVDDHSDDPIVLMMVVEALAEAGQWHEISRFADRLTETIATEYAFRLAATALLNTGDVTRCLDTIERWETRFDGGALPAVSFWRLRSAALAKLGDVRGATRSISKLLKQGGSAQDHEHAADIFLRFGDVRSAAPHIETLIEHDELSASDALNWSRAVQSDDPDLAEKLLDRAADIGVEPREVGSAYEIATTHSRDDLREKFGGDIADVADQPGSGIQSADMEDLKQWIQERRKHVADVQGLYEKGQITLGMACTAANDNIVLRLESAFSSIRSREWTDALFLYYGSRSQTIFQTSNIHDWIVCIDLTTLLVLDELGLLNRVRESAKIIRFPFELPAAFLELEDQLIERQPDRILTLRAILDAVTSGQLHSDESDEVTKHEERVRRVVFDLNDGNDGLREIQIQELFAAAVDRGILDSTDLRATNGPGKDAARTTVSIPDDTILVFDGNTIEEVIRVLGIDRLCRFATCVIESYYESAIRQEVNASTVRQKAHLRAQRLRREVSDGVKKGTYESMPEISQDVATKYGADNSQDAALFSLLSWPAEPNCMIAFDDRALNKYVSTDGNSVVCTLDIIEHLRRDEQISVDEYFAVRAKLRDANLYFAPPTADEVVNATIQANLHDGLLTETPSLRAVRRYLARHHSLQMLLDVEQRPGPPNEAPAIMATFRLAVNAIEKLFASEELGIEEAKVRATWIWRSLSQAIDERLPFFHRSAGSILEVLAMQLGSLLCSAMTNFMVSKRPNRADVLKSQIKWAWEVAVSPYIEGNPGLLPSLGDYFRRYIGLLFDQEQSAEIDATKEELDRLARALVPAFVSELPKELEECVLKDKEFAKRCGVIVTSVAGIQDIQLNAAEFRDGLIEAAQTGEPVTLEANDHSATICVSRGNSGAEPALVEIEGAVSLSYRDAFLSVFGDDRNQRLADFFGKSNRIDLPKTELTDLERKCDGLSDSELFEQLDLHCRQNVQNNYNQLEGSIRQNETLQKSNFEAPTPHMALQSLRVPHKTRKRFSFLLDLAVDSLIDQYGTIEAFDRVCGLPVDLASRFVEPFADLIKQRPRKTKRFLLSESGSVLSRIHKLAISAALADRDKISIAIIRKSIRALLSNWPSHSKLFLQLLQTTNHLQFHNAEFVELGAEQKLATVWTHSERLSRIVCNNVTSVDQATDYFRNISERAFARELQVDRAYETDVATPSVMHSPILLHFGMAYVHSHDNRVLSRPLLTEICELISYAGEPTSQLSPRLLQGRSNAPDSLDGFLRSAGAAYLDRFNQINASTLPTENWFDERKQEILERKTQTPPERLIWSEVIAHEQRWLGVPVRNQIINLVDTIDWRDLLTYGEETAICTSIVVAEMISYVEDESRAVESGSKFLTAIFAAANDAADEADANTQNSRLGFDQIPAEMAFQMSRAENLGRSCRILAACIRVLAQLTPKDESEFAEMLENAIPLLPGEHVLPLVEVRRWIRTRS